MRAFPCLNKLKFAFFQLVFAVRFVVKRYILQPGLEKT